jgi:hypothetical protein
MGFRTELQAQVLFLVLLFFSFASALVQCEYGSGLARASSNEDQRIGKVLSVRKVLRTPYFVSRYPQIHYYMLYISIRVSDQTYCSEYETPVLDEINDVLSADGKEVEVVLRDKKIILRTPQGRKLKVSLTKAKEC